MDSISLAAGFAVGALIGAGLCWVVMRARSAREIAEATARRVAEVAAARARLEESSKRVAQLERDLQHRERTLDATQREATALNLAHARVAAKLDGERKAAADKLALLEQADVKLREAFTRCPPRRSAAIANRFSSWPTRRWARSRSKPRSTWNTATARSTTW